MGQAAGADGEQPAVERDTPSPYVTARAGHASTRIANNLAAIAVLRTLEAEGRPALEREKDVLSTWSGWGALGEVFDESKDTYAPQRERLHELLGEDGYRAARGGVVGQFFTPGHLTEAIWETLREAGITTGRGLEPGCGSGQFIGYAPEGVHMTGVEVDPTTAAIAQALYPDAEIRAEGYETTPTTELFDFAVGNVPFSEVRLHDRANNPGNHTMHNHFIIKALSQTEPGGYVAVLTTHHTLDAANPAARRDMHERADLISAVRLPSNTFTHFTDTQVVSDLLIFRVRKDGEKPAPFTWEHASRQALPATKAGEEDHEVYVNDAVTSGQITVLGQMRAGVGMYGAVGLSVRSALPAGEDNPWNLAGLVRTAVRRDLEEAEHDGLGYAPVDVPVAAEVTLPDEVPIGTIRQAEAGAFMQRTDLGWDEMSVPATQREQLTALLDLRDRTRSLLDAEVTTRGDSPALEAQRSALADAYDAYTDRFGPLNAVKKTVSVRTNKDGEEVESIRRRWAPAMRTFMSDPGSALTRAIEVYDDDTEVATPAPILARRQVFATYEPKGADSPSDAIAISRTYKGSVDLDYCTYLLGATDPTQVREAMGDLVFDTPDGALVAREEYLSGDVRAKLDEARKAAEDNPAMAANVEALAGVLPKDLGVADVVPAVGATWIPASDYSDFLTGLLETRVDVTYNPVDGYKVDGGARGVQSTHVYGSMAMPAPAIFEAVLNAKPIKVMTTDDEGNRVLNVPATEVARGHAERMDEEFTGWLFRDPARTRRLLSEYNRRFNSLVPRSYDEAGERLELPGLADHFTLRTHQKAAVARMIAEPATGLFHEVGAGKTLEMVCGVMEQKRLGLVNKPLVVVPNHMLGQFEREWLQAYPAARILTAESTDLSKEAGRAMFMARATTSEWDAIICTQGAFQRLPVRPETVTAWQSRQIEDLDKWLAATQDTSSVRRAEVARQKLAAVLARDDDERQARSDDGVTFEDLGVDYLVVDEAHYYKNLSAKTNTVGILSASSPAKARDLQMKLDYLRRNHGDRVATFATATPIANTMGEMWVMTQYLRPDLLEKAGLASFDEWATTFTTMQTKVEVNPAGALRVRQRISQFKNMPELLTMWSTFADVKRREQLDLKVPDLERDADGRRVAHVVSVNAGEAMAEFSASLLSRGEKLEGGVDPREDNYLALTSDAKAVATDYRLLSDKSAARALGDVVTPFGHQKIDDVATNVARIYQETKDNVYTDDTGETSTIPGALQIVFCDQGTPKPGGAWNLYDELRDQLIESGVPAEKIAFIHEAGTSVQKDAMFARARSGAIAVLIGSTEKMGTGANMQKRAVALHHVTCPWRPCDITQREGRIIRQGNENPEVGIYRYVTEGSFDTFLWQSVERKVSFINQVMDARVTDRSMDAVDISDDEADFAQVKAIASGNPLEMEVARLSNEVTGLERRSKQFEREQSYLRTLAPALDRQYDTLLRNATHIEETLAPAQGHKDFQMRINGEMFTERTKAAEVLSRELLDRMDDPQVYYVSPNAAVPLRGLPIEYNGVDMDLLRLPVPHTPNGAVDHSKPQSWVIGVTRLNDDQWYEGHHGARVDWQVATAGGVGMIRRIENHVASLPKEAAHFRALAQENREEKERTTAQLGAENPWTERLATAKRELAAVKARIAQGDASDDQEALPTLAAPADTLGRTRSVFQVAMTGSQSAANTSPAQGHNEGQPWQQRSPRLAPPTQQTHQRPDRL